MRQVVLYIAMSLDGYIADENGGVGWLCGHEPKEDDMGSYSQFIETVDTVIMGYDTYHQIANELSKEAWPYAGMKSYVITHRKLKDRDDIAFTMENMEDLIGRLLKENGKDIWICGGAKIVNQLAQKDLIDKYCITVIPAIIGGGVRLFNEDNREIKLRLIGTGEYNGMVDLVYERR